MGSGARVSRPRAFPSAPRSVGGEVGVAALLLLVALLANTAAAATAAGLPGAAPSAGGPGHEGYTESIPGTAVTFRMVALPGGLFAMGSPEGEPQRAPEEGPVHHVALSPFWMGENEVSWDEYDAFLRATGGPRPTASGRNVGGGVDAISRASPPWGAPDQGWGKGTRPAITMTWEAANAYCAWLSAVTGRRYRLPTEAEWEYACRGGTTTSYFFRGDAGTYSGHGILGSWLKPDLSVIGAHVIFSGNSSRRTGVPGDVKPNPFGLRNMLGNVAEFCADYHSPDAYRGGGPWIDPKGPREGLERVIRGGSFKSDAGSVRCASRDHTRTASCLASDPRMPKGRWWYTDCNDIGFRVVREAGGPATR